MTKTLIKTAILCLAAFSTSVFAEKIIIYGKPLTLQRKGEIYLIPETYKLTKDYQYVIIDGKERACFLDKRPDLVNLDVVSINVQVGTQQATWNCYSPDPSYFVIQER